MHTNIITLPIFRLHLSIQYVQYENINSKEDIRLKIFFTSWNYLFTFTNSSHVITSYLNRHYYAREIDKMQTTQSQRQVHHTLNEKKISVCLCINNIRKMCKNLCKGKFIIIVIFFQEWSFSWVNLQPVLMPFFLFKKTSKS